MSAIHASVAALAVIGFTAASHAQSTPLGQASIAVSEASVASAESVAALTEAGFKVSVGVIAVPLAVAGVTAEAVGASAADAGEAGLRFANEPLTVTNRVAVREPDPLPELKD